MLNHFSKYHILFSLSLFVFVFDIGAQIGGVVNDYQKVTNINLDTVTVDNASDFSKGDKAMLFQVTGALLHIEKDKVNPDIDAELDLINNTGIFEILIIDTVDYAQNKIIFESEVEKNYNIGEVIQLIRIPEFESVSVDSEISAQPWNGETGGVVALIANKSLTLNANIDVTGQGFRGADPDDQADYLGQCRNTSGTEYDSLDYYFNTEHRAGLKGEGFVTINNKYTRGYSSMANGGGGGNGRYAGGGGGSNIIDGGSGGAEFKECGASTSYNTDGGMFDVGITEFYYFSVAKPNPRITFGGGGGTSNQNLDSSYVATKGGNGGGIVIILADTIIGNGNAIIANGESVTDTATAGGGGGGGGGAIIMAVNYYADENIELLANGGGGGVVGNPHADSLFGPGGGGGRGVIWHSFKNLPPAVFAKTQYDFGTRGLNLVGPPLDKAHGATDGADSLSGLPRKYANLVLPLTGFLFNTVFEDDTICEGEEAALLKATRPRGGIGVYSYQWQKRTNFSSWQNVGNIADSLTYTPGVLTDTTHFRRIVTSGSFNDTSKVITIYVHDAITGNTIGSEQKICSEQAPNMLTGNSYGGGNNTEYDFQWEVSSDNSDFSPVVSGGKNETYSPGVLNDTLYYRREINSGVCTNYSNSVLIMVLDPIVDNNISLEHDVCIGNEGLPLTGEPPTGGDNTDYTFLWEQSDDNVIWTSATGTNDQPGYNPPVINDTIYYRRYVTSGAGLCESTSNILRIDALNPVENNVISDNDTVCYNDKIVLNGLLPVKGNGSYSYKWIHSDDNISWDTIQGVANKNLNSNPLTGNTYFRRIVISGRNDACIDTSNAVFIRVWSSIEGNVIAADEEVCEGVLPQNKTGTQILSGGDESEYLYRWQIKTAEGAYTELQGNNTNAAYSFIQVLDPGEYYIRRRVVSDVCTDFSDSISLRVLREISNNSISTSDNVCYNNDPVTFSSENLAGGNTTTYDFEWQYALNTDVFMDVAENGNVQNYTFRGLTQPISFRRIVQSGACTDTSNIVNVDILSLPVSNIINTYDTLCQGESLIIKLELQGVSPWQINYQDENMIMQSVDVDQDNKEIELTPTSSYTFTTLQVIDANNCEATEMDGAANIEVYTFPEALGGEDLEVCGDQITLDGSEGFEVEWEYNANEVEIDNVNEPKAVATKVQYGQTSLNYHMYNWECEVVDEVVVTFYEQPEKPFAGNDITLDYGTKTMLEAEMPAVGTGTWSDTDTASIVEFVDKNDPKTVVQNLVRGEQYEFVWKVVHGTCPSVSDTLLIISDELKAPEGFSPNNDNKNDFFIIKAYNSLEEGEYIELHVFNRRGLEVYNSDKYKNDWDGRSLNGNHLPEGIYFYVLKIKKSDGTISGKPIDGFVVIKR